ncbi:ATP-grasp domain-containing protein [Halobacterium salinarum]|uniref:carboxylate--amine ligase n=1 Tax=Halobacterium salinarum TaxID=2242 RepID=UPI002555CBBD|nr:ATP-grasp domain-containing protein [Halobacterium salinarum]MDL0125111.1 ATP-grasp domain-containing protein [Halobacterium salinarum]
MKVLVTDGRSLATLAAVRSLGKCGHTIHCGESFKHNLSSYSKYADTRVVYPDPEENPREFINHLISLSERESYDLIIPVRDAATLAISCHKDVLEEHTNVVISDHDTLSPFMDKGETVRIAQQAGVPVPDTWFPEDTPKETIRESVDYPVLVRPRRSSGSRGIRYVSHSREFDEAYDFVSQKYGIPLVQEYIEHSGGHYSIGTIFDTNATPVATHVYEETKQYPVSGGPAVEAVSVSPPEWTEDLLQLLEYVGWIGPAHMDVLFDPKSNEPKLLEVNPRLWMSIQIAISAGVDVPNIIASIGDGKELTQVHNYKTDVQYRWLLPNGILWVVDNDDRLTALKELLTSDLQSQCYGALNLRDLGPVLGTCAQSLRYLMDKEKRAQIFDRGW